MVSTSEKVTQLRQLLSERFGAPKSEDKTTYLTGLSALDEIGLPQAAITEIVAPPSAGPGGALLLYGLLHRVLDKGSRVALVDAHDSFDPKGLKQDSLDRLLWSRCHNASEALKAADLIVRDGNLPLVILHMALNPVSQLRRVPSTSWHRLQMLAEKSAVTLLIVTPFAQVGCAQLRLGVSGAFPLHMLNLNWNELVPSMSLTVERRRTGRERRCLDEDLRRAVCA